ncbi:MAG: hypothetical protein ABFD54_10300 [Armatimonadota bacterium]|nr:hypothetical protein [bacterium]
MRITTICILTIAFLCFDCSQINALGKVTVDPNMNGSSVVDNVAEDPATSTRISYEGNNLPLEQHLASITKLSGIALQPSASSRNWQVRERTATLLLKEITITDLKAGLAQLFTYRWSKVSDGVKNVYVLSESARAMAARNVAVDDERQKAAMRRAAFIDKAISDAFLASSIADKPDELKAAKENDPWIYYLASNPTGQLWAQLIQEVPDEWWQQMCLGTSKGATRYYAQQVPSTVGNLLNQIISLSPSVTSSDECNDRIRPLGVVQLMSSDNDQAGFLEVFVKANDVKMEFVESIPIGPSNSGSCKFLGKVFSQMESGKTRDEATKAIRNEKTPVANPPSDTIPEKEDSFMQQQIEHAPIDAPDEADRRNDTEVVRHLRGLAKETGLNIMMETFDGASQSCCDVPKDGTIAEILKAICGDNLTWQRNGKLLMLNYKDWAQRRAEEVPKTLINRWEKLARSHLGLTFDDLLDIVQKTSYKQFSVTLARNKLLSTAGIREALETDLYAELSILAQISDSNTRKLYQSTTGIPLKLVMGLDFSSEPLSDFKKSLDMWYSGDPDGTIGIVIKDLGQDNPQGHQQVKIFFRLSDGYVNWSTGVVTPSSSSVKSFIDKLDKHTDKAIIQAPSNSKVSSTPHPLKLK